MEGRVAAVYVGLYRMSRYRQVIGMHGRGGNRIRAVPPLPFGLPVKAHAVIHKA
jgi:hypothetical protein